MLIMIFLGILIAVSLIIVLINRKCNATLFYTFASILIVASIVFIALGIWATIVKCREDIDYRQTVYERDELQYRWDCSNHDAMQLYDDIVRFNRELCSCKHYYDNLWIGIFFNDKVATIEYVDIGGIDYDTRTA